MTEVGSVVVQVPPGPAGYLRLQPAAGYARHTGGVEKMVLSLTAKGLTSGEIVAHHVGTYGMETVSTITDEAWASWPTGARGRSIWSIRSCSWTA
ncbi:hypothetical protein GT002_08790 [Streptomyces sp. SID4917]|nr:hypothetical protein [Streptomyces sp. SID4917]SCF73549.1 hypothetical protein GA0115259_101807 [Streptomyces sp. MnatMP-M17]